MIDPGILIGALAIGTIGTVLVATTWHFAKFLRHPENRDHAHNVFVQDGKAAATVTAEQAAPGSQAAKPLPVRLDQSIASQHELDPGLAESQDQRTTRFNRERVDATPSPAAAHAASK